MKRCIFFIVCIFIAVIGYCQDNERQPWGIWNDFEVTKDNRRRVKTFDGEYYQCGAFLDLSITQRHSVKPYYSVGMNYPGYEGPAFVIQGGYWKILKVERTEYGFLFYLSGQGVRYNKDTIPSFKDDFEGQVRMIFLSENECQFVFENIIDAEGYSMSKFLSENFTYRRVPVK
jgi:hypothetical protein